MDSILRKARNLHLGLSSQAQHVIMIKLNFGAGMGTPPHLVGELFKVVTGTDIVFIPYKGAAASMTDVLSGQMQMTIDGLTTSIPHIQSGKVRALAVMSPETWGELRAQGFEGWPVAADRRRIVIANLGVAR